MCNAARIYLSTHALHNTLHNQYTVNHFTRLYHQWLAAKIYFWECNKVDSTSHFPLSISLKLTMLYIIFDDEIVVELHINLWIKKYEVSSKCVRHFNFVLTAFQFIQFYFLNPLKYDPIIQHRIFAIFQNIFDLNQNEIQLCFYIFHKFSFTNRNSVSIIWGTINIIKKIYFWKIQCFIACLI